MLDSLYMAMILGCFRPRTDDGRGKLSVVSACLPACPSMTTTSSILCTEALTTSCVLIHPYTNCTLVRVYSLAGKTAKRKRPRSSQHTHAHMHTRTLHILSVVTGVNRTVVYPFLLPLHTTHIQIHLHTTSKFRVMVC